MKDILKSLEEKIYKHSSSSELTGKDLQLYPEVVRQLHAYRIFGQDLLAIPANLVNQGDDDEFEIPFSFTGSPETLEIFEKEFRPEIPGAFVQIGSLYGATEIVLLNIHNHLVHVFHVSDTVDREWLKYKLDNAICNLQTLIENIRLQTVCCLINPNNYSQWDIFEIRSETELKDGEKITAYSDKQTAWAEYKKLVHLSLNNGYRLHYAPKILREEL